MMCFCVAGKRLPQKSRQNRKEVCGAIITWKYFQIKHVGFEVGNEVCLKRLSYLVYQTGACLNVF